ncbi:MAG: phosphatase PAP2 family protein [Anaerolineae bacterium]|nr:phosphatase PAP2 family protein [Anaerolineae bacterium]
MSSTPKAWTPNARLAWLCVLAAVALLYLPINRIVKGGVILSLPWDALVPFWPIWAVPYLLCIPWWVASFIWAARRMDDARYRAFVVAALAAMLTAYTVFVLYPTYVERPVPVGHSWPVELVRSIYNNDRLNNAFPSAHTYTTVLIALFWWDWRPKLRWLWATMAIVVVLSTLFTGQHNLLDPVGGIIWAYAGYRFGWWWVRRPQARRREG